MKRRGSTPSTATAQQRRVWDRVAPIYDRTMSLLESWLFRGAREWIGDRARGRMLEVAVGTGRSLPFYRADTMITGFDLSPRMLELAGRRAAASGIQLAGLREGDAEALPFDDASFDTVVCALALCSIPTPQAAIEEMRRVLRPGGQLLLLDHVGSTWPPVYAVQWLVERLTIPAAGEHFTRRQLPLVLDAGFEIVEQERRGLGIIERIRARKPLGDR